MNFLTQIFEQSNLSIWWVNTKVKDINQYLLSVLHSTYKFVIEHDNNKEFTER